MEVTVFNKDGTEVKQTSPAPLSTPIPQMHDIGVLHRIVHFCPITNFLPFFFTPALWPVRQASPWCPRTVLNKRCLRKRSAACVRPQRTPVPDDDSQMKLRGRFSDTAAVVSVYLDGSFRVHTPYL